MNDLVSSINGVCEKRLALLAYADDLVILASTAEGAQRILHSLAKTAALVGLTINTKKTEVCTIPTDLPANLYLPSSIGSTAAPLPRCEQFCYLGGLVPNVREDFRRRRGLAWAAFRSVRVVLQCATLTDKLRGRLFQAVVETVLLYNAESWTMTETLERELDAAHSHLLRASFRIHHRVDPISNRALYSRAGLKPPSVTIQQRRLKLVGHVIRASSYCPEPLQDVLLLKLHGVFRRGQARTLRFVDRLLEDAGAPDQASGAAFVSKLATNRVI